MSLTPGTRLGPYEILAAIGKGGMGEVYRAHDSRLGRDVAIKVLTGAHVDDERLRRFAHEARAAAALEHPNILAVYDFGTFKKRTYLVSELLDGQPLNSRISGQPLHVDHVLDYAVQIADGLEAAHERGVVHRDLKPGNLFVTTRGLVKILDFGLARINVPVSQHTGVPTMGRGTTAVINTGSGMVLGTVPYMSPEQARGESVDARSDVFSFGLVLHEMATGQRAFDGGTTALVFDAILNHPIKPISKLNAEVPVELERIVDRCVMKRPETRYQHMREVLMDLRALKRLRDSGTPSHPSHGIARAVPSIAVLPFADLSPEKDQDYFCEGMAEELISALAGLQGIRVASRTSSFQFKGKSVDVADIGAKLKVETVLEGSVRKAGKRLRISVQLVSASDGYQLWSERYDRDSDDVFAVQDEIARAVVEKLKVKLSGDAPVVKHVTDDFAAYQLYLQGRYFWARRGVFLEKAADCFARAIEQDPSCAQAHAGLADAYGVLGIYGALSPSEAALKAKPAAERALALEDSLAEAHRSLAVINVSFEWDLVSGEREYRRALELSPASGELRAMHAYCLTYLHRFDEALAEVDQARQLEPESILVAGYNAMILMFGRRYPEALDECRRCLELDPTFATAEWIRTQVYTVLRDHQSAIEASERALALTRRRSFYLSASGVARAAAGQRAEAERVIDELIGRSGTEYLSPLWIADITTQLGDADRAFEWLEKAFAARTQALISLGVSPLYDPLRADKRFADLLRRIGVAGVNMVAA